MIRGLVIDISGRIEEKDCWANRPESNINNSGTTFEVLHAFDYGQKKIFIFGSKNGPREIINRYEMPHPMDVYIQYGDILIMSQFRDQPCSLYEREWLQCYEEQMGEFEDLDYTESDDEEESIGDYDYSDEFIVDDRDVDGDLIMN